MGTKVITPDMLQRMDACWHAVSHVSVAGIHHSGQPPLKRPLALPDVKHRLLAQWAPPPPRNYFYAYKDRVIKQFETKMVFLSAPAEESPAEALPWAGKKEFPLKS